MANVKEFLKAKNIDITNNKSLDGNKLIGDLSQENYKLNFEKPTEELTDEDKYQISRSILMPDYKLKAFTKEELVEKFNQFFGL